MRSKKTTLRSFFMLALIWTASGAWAQNNPVTKEYYTESTSHIIAGGKDTVMHTKEYHGKEKLRVDSSMEGMEILGTSFSIMRMDKNLMWTVMPQQNAYLESVLSPQVKASMETAASLLDKSKMKLIGTETVNGQQADKYEVQPMPGHENCKAYTFLSKDLDLPVRAETHCGAESDAVTDYTNTKAGPQADDLFEAPAGYKKISQ